MHRLPSRIVAVMIGTILVFVVTVALSMIWMSRALDEQARVHSLGQVQHVRANLLGQTRMITLDYAKWGAALPMIAAKDLPWIYENIGLSTMTSQAFQLAVIWGGPFEEDIGWTDDGVAEGRSGLVDPATLGQAESHLGDIPIDAYDGTQFFAWRDGTLFVLAASRIEAADGKADPTAQDGDIARLLLGTRLTDEAIARIGGDYLLSGLELARQAPADHSSLPLLGAEGEPVAYLIWDMPRPGTTMLYRMALPLLLVILFTASLTLVGMALVRRNAKHLVAAEHQASTAARTDALTGLPNRAAFSEALAAPAVAGARAILFLDINGFKRINDGIGHAAGDQVIAQLARRLGRLSWSDRMLARIGGDEFVFLLTGAGAGSQAEWVAEGIERATAEPFDALGHQLRLTAAVGYAVQATDGMTGGDLLRQAELAMQEAKRRKDQGLPVAFGALIEKATQDARAIERELQAALERRGEFSIAYQPIAAPEGRLARVEALARWTSPELGMVPPDRFIAVAEQSGLIIRLGRVLLGLVCDDLVAHPDLRVSVNISPLQLMAPTFVQDLLADLARRGIDPARIEVELTESVVVDDPHLAADRLRELHEAGFSTALDDFGTGYSSIGYLRQMGFNTLKVDRSFVTGFCDKPERLALVNAMILLAHALGLRVVCEGVETEQEFEMLRELGCDMAQGYHLDRPLPIDVVAKRWLGGREAAVA